MSGLIASELITDTLIPIKVTTYEMAQSNKVYLSPKGKIPQGSEGKTLIRIKGYVLAAQFSQAVPKGMMALNMKLRESLLLTLFDKLPVHAYLPRPNDRPATSLELNIQFLQPPKELVELDDLEVLKQFRKKLTGFYVGVEQAFVLKYAKSLLVLTVERIEGGKDELFYLGPETIIKASASGVQWIKLKSAKIQKKQIFSDILARQQLKNDGLDEKIINDLSRLLFARSLSHTQLVKLGIKHEKGILLYGPSNRRKTLIARQLASVLKAQTTQMVYGSEIVGRSMEQSLEKIRKLFALAREDQKRFGQESPLHIVIIDQIDAICRRRGSGKMSEEIGVSELKACLNGLDNIIMIGITNRKDLIDDAILQPGMLGIHIYIEEDLVETQRSRTFQNYL